ncbi:MAG: TrkH family potassium uptake protein [Gammaproteobacteria bacterium]|jgi:trk system potassium uptake protein TrkH|nr:TrkH family potassium uptake protein [Gammaproteobacteria bacterium]
MHPRSIVFIVAIFATIFGVTLVVPAVIAWWNAELVEMWGFLGPMIAYLTLGGSLWLVGRNRSHDLGTHDAFLVVALFWILLSLLAAGPMLLVLSLSPVDAVFEAASGLTTTGATVLIGLDELPRSVLFYRQQLQWLGGMGLIVLGLAVMPTLGVGGMRLYLAEVPGPMKQEKLTPRLAQTARSLWVIYVTLTAICALGYWFAGMDLFDAVAHSFSTLSTGGFSTHDASLGYFDSAVIEGIAVFFMVLASLNFSLHFIFWQRRDPFVYVKDVEARTFLVFGALVVLLVSITLRFEGNYEQFPRSLRDATFELVSVITSTGFATVDFAHWPDFLPILLILISFIGGCGGSTAGGMKVLRVRLLVQQGIREVRQLVHPHAVLPVRLGSRVADERMVQSVWGFFAAYVMTFAVLDLLMIHSGLDEVSAFSAVATSLNNLGPGLGTVAFTFRDVSDFGKIIAVAAMLMGRLEIFTILVLLSPTFWRR